LQDTATLARLIRELGQTEHWRADQLHDAQSQMLGRMLRFAHDNVPFYRQRLSGLTDAGGFSRPRELLAALPVLTRGELKAHADDLHSAHARAPQALKFTTSGSTGMPVTVAWDRAANVLVAAIVARYHRWWQSQPSARYATLSAVPTDAQGRGRELRGMAWYPGQPASDGVAADAAQPVRQQLDWLLREQPRYLMTYPTNARALLRAARERGASLECLERIDTFGETAVEGLEALAREVCGAQLADRYSAREVGMIALECPDGNGYRVQSESVLVELLDEADQPVSEGDSGRVVVTSLQNIAMPLIRYEIGDYAQAGTAPAGGMPHPVLHRIHGRRRNMFRLPDGDRLWPRFNSDDLASMAPVRQFQLVQKSLALLELKMVVDRAATAEEEAALERLVRQRLKGNYALALRYVEDIPRSAGGKYEDFRCEMAD